jgi:GNAT superfamily N-acetyltransferase
MAALAFAADENLAAHASWAALQLGGRVLADDQLVVVDSGLPCDTFNLVCRARLDRPTAARRIGDALRFFGEVGHPFSWWLGPGFAPADLPALLISAGLHQAETERAMSLDLEALPPSTVDVSGLDIQRVRTVEALEAFALVAASNWQPPDPWVIKFYRRGLPAFLRPDCPQWFYIGLLDGLPVATAELTVGGGVVGLYNISTLAPYRGRGIGSAMTRAPLADARAAGWRTAILQAAEAGVGVYHRLGFAPFGDVTEFKPA